MATNYSAVGGTLPDGYEVQVSVSCDTTKWNCSTGMTTFTVTIQGPYGTTYFNATSPTLPFDCSQLGSLDFLYQSGGTPDSQYDFSGATLALSAPGT